MPEYFQGTTAVKHKRRMRYRCEISRQMNLMTGIWRCLFLNGRERYTQKGGKRSATRNNNISFQSSHLSSPNQICDTYCWTNGCDTHFFSSHSMRKSRNATFLSSIELSTAPEFSTHDMLIRSFAIDSQKLLAMSRSVASSLFLEISMR